MSLLSEATSRLVAETERFLSRQKPASQSPSTPAIRRRDRQAVGELLADVRRAAVASCAAPSAAPSAPPAAARRGEEGIAQSADDGAGPGRSRKADAVALPSLPTSQPGTAARLISSAPLAKTLTLPALRANHSTTTPSMTTRKKQRLGTSPQAAAPTRATGAAVVAAPGAKESDREAALQALITGRRAHAAPAAAGSGAAAVSKAKAAAAASVAADSRKPDRMRLAATGTVAATDAVRTPLAARLYFARVCAEQASAALEHGLVSEAADLFLKPSTDDIAALRPVAAILTGPRDGQGDRSMPPHEGGRAESEGGQPERGGATAPPVWDGQCGKRRGGATKNDEKGGKPCDAHLSESDLPLVVQAYLRVWQFDVLASLCTAHTVLQEDPFLDRAEATVRRLRELVQDQAVALALELVALSGQPIYADLHHPCFPEAVRRRARHYAASGQQDPSAAAAAEEEGLLFASPLRGPLSVPDVAYPILYAAITFLSDLMESVTQRAAQVEVAPTPHVASLYDMVIATLVACIDMCEGATAPGSHGGTSDGGFLSLATVPFLPWRLSLYEQLTKCCCVASAASVAGGKDDPRRFHDALRIARRAASKTRELVELECLDDVPPPAAWQDLLREAQQRAALQVLKYSWLAQSWTTATPAAAATGPESTATPAETDLSPCPTSGPAMLDAVWRCVLEHDKLPLLREASHHDQSLPLASLPAATATARAKDGAAAGHAGGKGKAREKGSKDAARAPADTAAADADASRQSTEEEQRRLAVQRHVRQFLRLAPPFVQSFLEASSDSMEPGRMQRTAASDLVPVAAPSSSSSTSPLRRAQQPAPQATTTMAALSLEESAAQALRLLLHLVTQRYWVQWKEQLLLRCPDDDDGDFFPFCVPQAIAEATALAQEAEAAKEARREPGEEQDATPGKAPTRSPPHASRKSAAHSGRSPRDGGTTAGNGADGRPDNNNNNNNAGAASTAAAAAAAASPTAGQRSTWDDPAVAEQLRLDIIFPHIFSTPKTSADAVDLARKEETARRSAEEAGTLLPPPPEEEATYADVVSLVSLVRGAFPSATCTTAAEAGAYIRHCAVLLRALDGAAADRRRSGAVAPAAGTKAAAAAASSKEGGIANVAPPSCGAEKAVLRWLALARATVAMLQRLCYAQGPFPPAAVAHLSLMEGPPPFLPAAPHRQDPLPLLEKVPVLLPVCETLEGTLRQLDDVLLSVTPPTRATLPLAVIYADLLARAGCYLLHTANAMAHQQREERLVREQLGIDGIEEGEADEQAGNSTTPAADRCPSTTHDAKAEREADILFRVTALALEALSATNAAGVRAMDTLSYSDLVNNAARDTLADIQAVIGYGSKKEKDAWQWEQGTDADADGGGGGGGAKPSPETLARLSHKARRALDVVETGLAAVQQRQAAALLDCAQCDGDNARDDAVSSQLLRDSRTSLTRLAVELRWYTALLQSQARAYHKRQKDVRTITARHARSSIFGAATLKESRVLQALLEEDPELPEAPAALEARLISSSTQEHPILRALVLLCIAGLQPSKRVARERYQSAMDILTRLRGSESTAQQVHSSTTATAVRPRDRSKADSGGEVHSPMLVWSMAATIGCRVGGPAAAAHIALAKSALYERFVANSEGGDRTLPAAAVSAVSGATHKDPESIATMKLLHNADAADAGGGALGISLALVPNREALASSSRAVQAALCEALLDISAAELAFAAKTTVTPAERQVASLRCSYRALFALTVAHSANDQPPSSSLSKSGDSQPIPVTSFMLRCAEQIYTGLLPCLHDGHHTPQVIEPMVAICNVLLRVDGSVWFDAALQLLAVRTLTAFHEVIGLAERTFLSSPSAAAVGGGSDGSNNNDKGGGTVWPARLQELRHLLLRSFVHVWNAVCVFPCQRQSRYMKSVQRANVLVRQAARSAAAMKKTTKGSGGGGGGATPVGATPAGDSEEGGGGIAVSFPGCEYVAVGGAESTTTTDLLMEDRMPIEYVELLERLLFSLPEAYATMAAAAAVGGGMSGLEKAGEAAKRSSLLPSKQQQQKQQQQEQPGSSNVNAIHGGGRAPSSTVTGTTDGPAAAALIDQLLHKAGSIVGLPIILHDICAVMAAAQQQQQQHASLAGNGNSTERDNSNSSSSAGVAATLQKGLQEALQRHRKDPAFARVAMRCVEWLVARRAYAAARALGVRVLHTLAENWQELKAHQREVLDTLRSWLVENGFVLTAGSAGNRKARQDDQQDNRNGSEEGQGGGGAARVPRPPAGAGGGGGGGGAKTARARGGAANSGRPRANKKLQKEEEAAQALATQAAADAADRERFLTVARAWTAPEQQMLRQLTRAIAWLRQRRAASLLRNRYFQFNAVFQAQIRLHVAALLRLEWTQLAQQQRQSPGAVISHASLLAACEVDRTCATTITNTAAAGEGEQPSETARRSASSSRGKLDKHAQQLLLAQQQQDTFDLTADNGVVHVAIARHCVQASHLFTRAFHPAHALRAAQLTVDDITTYVAGPSEDGGGGGVPFAHIFCCLSSSGGGENGAGSASDANLGPAPTAYSACRYLLSPVVLHQLEASSPSLLPLATELLAIMATITRGYCDFRRDLTVLQPAAIRTGRFVKRDQQVAWQGYVPSLSTRFNPTGAREEARAVARVRHDRLRALRQYRYWLHVTMREEAITRGVVTRAFYADLREGIAREEALSAVFPDALGRLPSAAQLDEAAEAEREHAEGAAAVHHNTHNNKNRAIALTAMKDHVGGDTDTPRTRPAQDMAKERERLHYFLYLDDKDTNSGSRKPRATVVKPQRHHRAVVVGQDLASDSQDDEVALSADEEDSRVEREVRVRQYGVDLPEERVMDALLVLAHSLQFTHPQETVKICQVAHTLTDGRYDAVLLPLALSIETALAGHCSQTLLAAYTAALRDASLGKTLLQSARGLRARYVSSDAFLLRVERRLATTLLPSLGLPLLADAASAMHGRQGSQGGDGGGTVTAGGLAYTDDDVDLASARVSFTGTSDTDSRADVMADTFGDYGGSGGGGGSSRRISATATTATRNRVTAKAVLAAYQAAVARLRESKQFALLGECLMEMGFLSLLHRSPVECERSWQEAVEALLELPRCCQQWRTQLGNTENEKSEEEEGMSTTAPRDAFTATTVGLPRILLAVHVLSCLGMYCYREKQAHAVDAYLFAERLLETYFISPATTPAAGVSCSFPRSLHGYTDFVIRTLPDCCCCCQAAAAAPNQLVESLAAVLPSLVNSLLFLVHELVANGYAANACLPGAVAEHLAQHYLQHVPTIAEARLQRARAAAAVGDFAAAMTFARAVCLGAGLPSLPLHLLLSDESAAAVGGQASLACSLGMGPNSGRGNADEAKKKAHSRPPLPDSQGGAGEHVTESAPAAAIPSSLGEAAGPSSSPTSRQSNSALACPLYNNGEPPTSLGNVAATHMFLNQCFPSAPLWETMVLPSSSPSPSPKQDEAAQASSVSPSRFLSPAVCDAYGPLLARRVILTVAEVLVCLCAREAAYLWPQYYHADTPETLDAAGASGAHKRPGSSSSGGGGARRRTSASSAVAAAAGASAGTTRAPGGEEVGADRSACVEAYKAAEYLLSTFIAAGTTAASLYASGRAGSAAAPATDAVAAGASASRKAGGKSLAAGASAASLSAARKKQGKSASPSPSGGGGGTSEGDENMDGSGVSASRVLSVYESVALSHHAKLLLATAATELGHSDMAIDLLHSHFRQVPSAEAVAAGTSVAASLALVMNGFGVCPLPGTPSFLLTIDDAHWRRVLHLLAVNYFRLRALDRLATVASEAVRRCARTQDAYGVRTFVLYQAAGQIQAGEAAQAIRTLRTLRDTTTAALSINNPADDVDAMVGFALSQLSDNTPPHASSAAAAQELLLSAMSALQTRAAFVGALAAPRISSSPSRRFAWAAPALVKLHAAVNAYAQRKLDAVVSSAFPGQKALEELRHTTLLLRHVLHSLGSGYDSARAHPSFLLHTKTLLARALLAAHTHHRPHGSGERARQQTASGDSPTPPSSSSASSSRGSLPLLRALPCPTASPAREIASLLVDVVDGIVSDGVHDYGLLRTALLELSVLLTEVMRGEQQQKRRSDGGEGGTDVLTQKQYRLLSSVASATSILANLVLHMSQQVFNGTNAFYDYNKDEAMTLDLACMSVRFPQPILAAIKATLLGGGNAGSSSERLKQCFTAPINSFYKEMLDSMAASAAGGAGGSSRRGAGGGGGGGGAPGSRLGRPATGQASLSDAAARLALTNGAVLSPAGAALAVPVSVLDMVTVFANLHRDWPTLVAVAPPIELLDHECALKLVKRYLQARSTPVSCTYLCYSADTRRAVTRSLCPQRTPVAAAAAGARRTAAGSAASLNLQQQVLQQQETLDLWSALVPPILLSHLPSGLLSSARGPDALGAPRINAVVASAFFSCSLSFGSDGGSSRGGGAAAAEDKKRNPRRHAAATMLDRWLDGTDSRLTTLTLAVSPFSDPTLDHAPPLSTAADRKRLLRQPEDLPRRNNSTGSGGTDTQTASETGRRQTLTGAGHHGGPCRDSSGSVAGARSRSRLATIGSAGSQPDGTRPRLVCVDAALHERIQELEQQHERSGRSRWLAFHGRSNTRQGELDGEDSERCSETESEHDDDEDESLALPHWRCVPLQLPTKLVAELRETADQVLSLLSTTSATAATSSAHWSGAATNQGSEKARARAKARSSTTAKTAANWAKPQSREGERESPRSVATSEATQNGHQDSSASRGEAATAATTFSEDARHLTGSQALRCGLALAMEALHTRTQPPPPPQQQQQQTPSSSGQQQQQQQQQAAASSSSRKSPGTRSSNTLVSLSDDSPPPTTTAPSAASSSSKASRRDSVVCRSHGSVTAAEGEKAEEGAEGEVDVLAEAKSHLLMTFLEAVVASVAQQHTRRPARHGSTEEEKRAAEDEDREQVVLGLLPRCAIDAALVRFLREWLAPGGDGAAVSFFHPGVHEWLSRLVDYVERQRLK